MPSASLLAPLIALFAPSPATTTMASPQPLPAATLAEPMDSARQRAELRALGLCLARARPRWAQRTLDHPYLGAAQARDAAAALSGDDQCHGRSDRDYVFRTSGLVASLAEDALRRRFATADGEALARALNSIGAANASEDFALCLAARDPDQARTLALSDPGSADEGAALARFAALVPDCTVAGETLAVDGQALRALVSVALYRAHSALARR